MNSSNFNAFTIKYTGIGKAIITEIMISEPIDGKEGDRIESGNHKTFSSNALWDTGATNSAITARVAAELGLKPYSTTKVLQAGGFYIANVYIISVFLPNKSVIAVLRVTECKNENETWDVIIGMDVISRGDFSITNVGITVMTFRIPSVKMIDYAQEATSIKESIFRKIGRNEHCPCGSKKKLKDCCWYKYH